MYKISKKRFGTRLMSFVLVLLLAATLLPATPVFAAPPPAGSTPDNPILHRLEDGVVDLTEPSEQSGLYHKITGTYDASASTRDIIINVTEYFNGHVIIEDVTIDLSEWDNLDSVIPVIVGGGPESNDTDTGRTIEFRGVNTITTAPLRSYTQNGYEFVNKQEGVRLGNTNVEGDGTLNIKAAGIAFSMSDGESADGTSFHLKDVIINAESNFDKALFLYAGIRPLAISGVTIDAKGSTRTEASDIGVNTPDDIYNVGIAINSSGTGGVAIDGSDITATGGYGMRIYGDDKVTVTNSVVTAKALPAEKEWQEAGQNTVFAKAGDGLLVNAWSFEENDDAGLIIGGGAVVTATGGDDLHGDSIQTLPGNGVSVTAGNLVVEQGGKLTDKSGTKQEYYSHDSYSREFNNGLLVDGSGFTVNGEAEFIGSDNDYYGGNGIMLKDADLQVGSTGKIIARGGRSGREGYASNYKHFSFGVAVWDYHSESTWEKAPGGSIKAYYGQYSDLEYPAAKITEYSINTLLTGNGIVEITDMADEILFPESLRITEQGDDPDEAGKSYFDLAWTAATPAPERYDVEYFVRGYWEDGKADEGEDGGWPDDEDWHGARIEYAANWLSARIIGLENESNYKFRVIARTGESESVSNEVSGKNGTILAFD